ncbi:hypothetical protein C8R43DRAFT_1232166 [Mycena crocata]|nr:hypothetical protein C8R43DRAFT_1232166 [Mycena crocata]
MCPPPSFQLHDPEKITPTEFEGKTTFLGRFFPRKSVKDRPNESEHGQPAPRGWMPYSKPESEQASAKLWAIYVAEADRYDTALVESWRADMEGMLIFSGLFSGSLTAFLIESYRSLRPDSGEITIQLLAQISQQLAAVYNNTVFTPPETVHFEPANTSLVCNTLWFISLSLSITCALLATLVEQWAREFLHKTQKRPSPVTRARVLSFLYFGVRRFGMHTVVDVIPMLLHVSLVLFLAGLVAFLLPINHIMAGLVIAVLTVFLVFYAILTLFPSFTLASPYRTPFSDLIWNILHKIRSHLAPSSAAPCIGSTMNDAVVQIAVQHSETRDRRAIAWTLESLTDDHEFHAFLSAIPESIYGIKGFHLANDYLFPPILNGMTPDHRPLGERITQFVISARNMDPGGPMRRRRILDAMKAIWALGMVSGRNGTLFHRGDRVWFDVTMQAALKSPTHSDPDWPAPFAEFTAFSRQIAGAPPRRQ